MSGVTGPANQAALVNSEMQGLAAQLPTDFIQGALMAVLSQKEHAAPASGATGLPAGDVF